MFPVARRQLVECFDRRSPRYGNEALELAAEAVEMGFENRWTQLGGSSRAAWRQRRSGRTSATSPAARASRTSWNCRGRPEIARSIPGHLFLQQRIGTTPVSAVGW